MPGRFIIWNERLYNVGIEASNIDWGNLGSNPQATVNLTG